MHEISSINIKPIKPTSERHNYRIGPKLDYPFYDRTHLNKSIRYFKISDYRKYIELLVKEKTGRKLQATATPIREGVLNLSKHSKMKDLKLVAERLYEGFGIKTLQIHIHEDEGIIDKGVFIQNKHAHMVFSWMDEETGKSLKLNRQNMSEIQDVVAVALKMERGASSNKKHLSAQQYKNQQEQLKLEKAQEKLNEINQATTTEKKEYAKTIVKHKAENINEKLKTGGLNALSVLTGKKDKTIGILKKELAQNKLSIENLNHENNALKLNVNKINHQANDLETKNKELQHQYHLAAEERDDLEKKIINANKQNERYRESLEKLQNFNKIITTLIVDGFINNKKESISRLSEWAKKIYGQQVSRDNQVKKKPNSNNNDLER